MVRGAQTRGIATGPPYYLSSWPPPKRIQKQSEFLELSRERFFGVQKRFWAMSGPIRVQNGAKMDRIWLQKWSPTGLLIRNSFFLTISLTFSKKILPTFQNTKEGQKSYTGADTMKKWCISQVSHYQRARVDDPQNVSKKPSNYRSKINQKSIESRFWKPSKSVFRFFCALTHPKSTF